MSVPELVNSRWNHGTNPDLIVMTHTTQTEVSFNVDDIINVLKSCYSDDMAKVINVIGKHMHDEYARCWAADDLDEHGKEFIDTMHYFIHSNDPK